MRASTTATASGVDTATWHAGYMQRLFRHAPSDHEPVILRHRRIYILPTKRGVAFLATLAMTLLTSLNYSLSLGFVATFLLVGLVAAVAHPHVSQPRGHRASSARRRRDVRRRRDAVHADVGRRRDAPLRDHAVGARLLPR